MSNPVVKILDETTANKIAAGEVVERPASVIKELVENSLDAKSKSIEIEIIDGGTNYIRVTDDGIGMSKENAQKAILRHATSKISVAEDLESIYSLGFRGEALPSIAAVSKFTLTTRVIDDNFAARIIIEGGNVLEVSEAGASPGTTVIIEDLFYNTPARRKFLKSITSESSHIVDIVAKLALSYPNIAFKLINNKKLVLTTPGQNEFIETISSIYGHKVKPELLEISTDEAPVSVSGFISKPTLLKGTRNWQTIIVNGRVVNSRFISKAIDNAYHSLLPKNGYPLAVINIKVDASTIDVNVHPQKTEIKFSDEKPIYRAVYRAITNALTVPHTLQQIAAATIENVKIPFINSNKPQPFITPLLAEDKNYVRESSISFSRAREIKEQQDLAPVTSQNVLPDVKEDRGLELYPLGQLDNLYIIAQGADGLYIIDQHAAHERILYDRLCMNTDRIPVQQLLIPILIEFDASEVEIITLYHDFLYSLGLTLELIGPNTMRLVEAPADLKTENIESVIRETITYLSEMHNPSPQELRHKFLQIAACRSAIKAGDVLNMRQMQALIAQLCTTTLPFTCPHGRPSMVKFSQHDLAKLFKRL